MPATPKLNADLPRYAGVKEWLKREFQSYELDTQLPSDRKIAEKLRVSFLTVNRAMRELAEEGYLIRRPRQGTFLAARENPVAREPQRRAKGEIIFSLPDHYSYGYWSRLKCAQELAVKAGFTLTEYRIPPGSNYDGLLNFIRSRPSVQATLIIPVPGSIDRELFERIDQLGHRVVLLEACPFVSTGKNVHSISGDAYQDGYLKVEYLAKRGHRDIGYVANEPENAGSPLAYQGMKQALKDHGLLLKNLHYSPPTIKAWGSSCEAGYRQTRELLSKQDVTAIICDSAPGAMGCLRALWELGKKVPEEISVIAGELHEDTEANMVPPLTTVASRSAAEIALAFELIQQEKPSENKTHAISLVVKERKSVQNLKAQKTRD